MEQLQRNKYTSLYETGQVQLKIVCEHLKTRKKYVDREESITVRRRKARWTT